jgi:ATP-dependent Clp protease protease subunit
MITIAGHKRFAYETSTLMYHQISSGVIGKAKDIEEEVIEVRRLQSWLEEYTMKKTKIGCEKLEEVYSTKHDWYMTSQEALELGVINEII